MCECISGDTYGIRSTSKGEIQAYCDRWTGEDFEWCYISGHSNAASCSGAVKSRAGEYYWSKDAGICAGIGKDGC